VLLASLQLAREQRILLGEHQRVRPARAPRAVRHGQIVAVDLLMHMHMHMAAPLGAALRDAGVRLPEVDDLLSRRRGEPRGSLD
jgi:hypothetical protein